MFVCVFLLKGLTLVYMNVSDIRTRVCAAATERMLCLSDCTFTSSRICHKQLLTWTCVRLRLSAPSVTLRLFDSQAQKNTTFFGRRVFTTPLPQRAKLRPFMKSTKGMREGGEQQRRAALLYIFLAGSLWHDVTLQREMKGGLCGPLKCWSGAEAL